MFNHPWLCSERAVFIWLACKFSSLHCTIKSSWKNYGTWSSSWWTSFSWLSGAYDFHLEFPARYTSAFHLLSGCLFWLISHGKKILAWKNNYVSFCFQSKLNSCTECSNWIYIYIYIYIFSFGVWTVIWEVSNIWWSLLVCGIITLPSYVLGTVTSSFLRYCADRHQENICSVYIFWDNAI